MMNTMKWCNLKNQKKKKNNNKKKKEKTEIKFESAEV